MWPSVCVYVQKVKSDKRYTEPTCKSYTIIKGATTDVMVPAKMATFETFASQLQPFLTTFQSDNPLLPFVCSELQKIITALMKRFVQPSILAEVQTATQLMKVKHQDSATCVKPGKVDVGYIAERELKQLLKRKAVSDVRVYTFRQQCMSFLRAIIAKMIAKTPIAHAFARNLASLDPCKIANDRRGSASRFKHVLEHLVQCKHIKLREVDALLLQFDTFIERVAADSACAFRAYIYKSDRLDALLVQHLSHHDDLGQLWTIVKNLLILSHGQATVEKGFSINRQIMVENMKEASFIAQRSIHDHLLNIGGMDALVINRALLASAANGHKRYVAHLEDERRKVAESARGTKRRAVQEEINEVQKKVKVIQATIESMKGDADKLADKAESTGSLVFLMKSNASRRSAKEKEAELVQLTETVKALQKKQADMPV